MKNFKLQYLGYLIALFSLIYLLLSNPSKLQKVIFIIIFSVSLSISFVSSVHKKMLKNDKDYAVNLKDERSEKIRDKINAIISIILQFSLGITAITCFVIENYIPAIMLTIINLCIPVIVIFLSKYYEKKY